MKRKEPQELTEADMKRPRPSTPPDEDDDGLSNSDDVMSEEDRLTLVWFSGVHGRMPDVGREGRDNKRRKKKPRSRKPWELDSEGEETSDGSSSEKV